MNTSVYCYFEYMYSLIGYKAEEPIVSVVAVMGKCCEYIDCFLDSVLAQSEKRVEILLYENDSDDATKSAVREYMAKEPHICVRLGEWQPVSEKYNDAIQTAKGKYICFLNTFDYIQDPDWLNNAIAAFEDDAVDLVGYKEGFSGKSYVENCQNGCYRQFLYRIEKIRTRKLKFEDYSLLTGSVFFTKYCLDSNYAYFIPKFMMRGNSFKRTAIYADEAKLVMRAFVWLLQTAKDNDLKELACKVTELLNSENYIRLITDATYGFYLDRSSIDNPREDFNSEILSLLLQANELAYLHGEDKALLRTLSMFIAKRHLFLENI